MTDMDIFDLIGQEMEEESSKDTITPTYPKWVADTPDSLSKDIYINMLDMYEVCKTYIKGHSKKTHYAPGTKTNWQLVKVDIARKVGFDVGSQIFVDKPYSLDLVKDFDDLNAKLINWKDKKLNAQGFRNQKKDIIADDYSILKAKCAALEKSNAKEVVDESLKVLPMAVLKKLGLEVAVLEQRGVYTSIKAVK